METASSRGNSTERSESCIKEIPMSGDRNRFSRSKSPKARWHEHEQSQLSEEMGKVAAAISVSDTNIKSIESSNSGSSGPNEDEKSPSEEKTKDLIEVTTSTSLTNVSTTITTTTTTTTPSSAKVQKKRKWLGNDATAASLLSTKKSMAISSDTLKSYLPTNPNENLSKMMSREDSESADEQMVGSDGVVVQQASKRKVIEPGELVSMVPDSSTSSASSQQIQKQSSRTVILEVGLFCFV
jgi:hypothetical protein